MSHPDFASYPYSGYGDDKQSEDDTLKYWEPEDQEVDPDETTWGLNQNVNDRFQNNRESDNWKDDFPFNFDSGRDERFTW